MAHTAIARYAYDSMGRRISKTVNGETTFYLYADEGLLAELDDTGNILVAYGWQANAMFGTAPLWQAQVNNGNLQTAQYHFLYTDHLGTPQLAVNANGQTTWRAHSEAFGKTTLNAGNQVTMNLRFPGQYFDAENNTHYNYYRDYQPETGRYIQQDPIGLNAGVNMYAYVQASPLRLIDIMGLNPADWSEFSRNSNNRQCAPPNECQKNCIEQVLGEPIDGVTVEQTSLLLGVGVGAQSHRERVYSGYSCEVFWSRPDLFLHEFYHVTKQWRGNGGLNEVSYLREMWATGSAALGNRYEDEAYEFSGYQNTPNNPNQLAYKDCFAKCESEKDDCPTK